MTSKGRDLRRVPLHHRCAMVPLPEQAREEGDDKARRKIPPRLALLPIPTACGATRTARRIMCSRQLALEFGERAVDLIPRRRIGCPGYNLMDDPPILH